MRKKSILTCNSSSLKKELVNAFNHKYAREKVYMKIESFTQKKVTHFVILQVFKY